MKPPPSYNSEDASKFEDTHVFISPQVLSQATQPSAPPASYQPQYLNPTRLEPLQTIQIPPPGYLESSNTPPPPYHSIETQSLSVGELRDMRVIMATAYGPYPMSMPCPFCRHNIVTDVQNKSGVFAWLICGALALVGCWPCCCLPLCMTNCQDKLHFCPSCKNFLGCYKKL
ncbi:unnamed protein product [Bursaphelenchus okinawaensis]|uniref:LITAF domain-containing protein n=1 Tax=Bursaphelenchus okinawaensis TaxID=465554 RepID=A0A811KGP3_9BILA|nr:unnamed protein product [Bursaphelenchus okinawaensis]CAG9102958.1 unnamed protein product [Bursaphelenchus okinawaensis]